MCVCVCVCVCVYTHIYIYADAVQLDAKENHFPLLELSWIDLYTCSKFKMLVVQPWQDLDMKWKTPAGLVKASDPGLSGRFQVPVLVKGIEKSCWRSWFSDVLSMTTTSAGRVSLFFSRTPEASYNTCNTNSKSQVSQYHPHHWRHGHIVRGQ